MNAESVRRDNVTRDFRHGTRGESAAYATAYAAARAAARLRQRDTLLALCNAAIANPPATTSPHKPPFDKPRNHDEEIANVKAGRDWYKAQKGITE